MKFSGFCQIVAYFLLNFKCFKFQKILFMAAAHKVFELSHVFKDVSKIGDDESVCSPNEDYFGVPWSVKYE